MINPKARPNTTSAASASILPEVKMFWISFPYLSPRALVQVSARITSRATNWVVERETA